MEKEVLLEEIIIYLKKEAISLNFSSCCFTNIFNACIGLRLAETLSRWYRIYLISNFIQITMNFTDEDNAPHDVCWNQYSFIKLNNSENIYILYTY